MRIAVCCAMNNNRSMSIHDLFFRNGISVSSYGTSEEIKFPGETQNTPNLYSYNITYIEIMEDLKRKNESFYQKRGLIKMLERNMSIKERPEYFFDKFKHVDNDTMIRYDRDTIEDVTKIQSHNIEIPEVIFCCDKRCFDRIFNAFRTPPTESDSILILFDVKDTLLDAERDAQCILEFTKTMLSSVNKDKALKYSVEDGKRFYWERLEKAVLLAPIKL